MAMKRVTLRGPFDVVVEEVEIPRPARGELLVRTCLSGVSMGTEMHLYRGEHPNLSSGKWGYWTAYPVQPGYEATGFVVGRGEGVQGFAEGTRVLGLCPHAEYFVVPASQAVEIPHHVSFEKATLAVLSATTMHAVRRAAPPYGAEAAVIGLGKVGLLALAQLKLAGCGRVAGLDLREERRSLALRMGASEAFDPAEAGFEALFRSAYPSGCDVVMEASGTPQAMELAFRLCRDQGRVVALGFSPRPITVMFGDDFFHKELELRASRGIGPEEAAAPAGRWTGRENVSGAMALIASGALELAPLLEHSKTFPFREIQHVYRLIHQGDHDYVQVYLDWS